VSGRGTRRTAHVGLETRAVDPTVGISAVQTFIVDPSPGLRAAAMANTAVFTSGFGVLRLGLTLAGIAHSWFLGTVRESRSIYAAMPHDLLALEMHRSNHRGR
jgi:hypothetical protein